jgi:hypothetical protein
LLTSARATLDSGQAPRDGRRHSSQPPRCAPPLLLGERDARVRELPHRLHRPFFGHVRRYDLFRDGQQGWWFGLVEEVVPGEA